MSEPVGVIGLGQIGLPIARNLIASGNSVVGYRRTNANLLSEIGGHAAANAREVAQRCKVIISCLPDANAVEEAVTGDTGLLAGDCTGLLLIEISTIDLAVKQRLHDRLNAAGASMIDGAISGIPKMVAERKGVVYASGSQDDFARAEPIIKGFADQVVYFGPFGMGTKAKLTTNLLLALNIMATAEALAFGMKAGIPSDRLIAALGEGAATSLQFKVRAPMMAQRNWDHGMGPTWMLQKDLELARKLGRQIECPTPLTDRASLIYQEAISAGYSNADVAAVFAVVAEHAGLSEKSAKKVEPCAQSTVSAPSRYGLARIFPWLSSRRDSTR